jgi:uncharacterized membrane-anchored protein YitT (DUF2179 family)
VPTTKIHPLIDIERQKIARGYRSDNRKVGILSLVVAAGFLLILLYFDISKQLVGLTGQHIASRMLLILIYFSVLYVVYSLLNLPFAFVEGYSIEHKYGFSTRIEGPGFWIG